MRHEIGVENRDKLGRVGIIAQHGQCMVDVAGLRVGIVRPRQIKRALFLAQGCEPGPSPVVEHPDPHSREIDTERADDAAFQDAPIFVVGRDQHIDTRRCLPGQPRRLLGRLLASVLRPRQVEEAERPAEASQRLDDRKRPGIQAVEV